MVRLLSAIAMIMVLFAVSGLPQPAMAQQEEAATADLRERVNKGTVRLISGGVDGTYIRIAADLANVLDRREDLRILPIVGKGSVQNITDILYLRGTDIGIVQSDVLAYMKKGGIHPTIDKRIRYITKLYNEEFHLLTAGEVNSFEDLAGRKVNFGPQGSGTYMTASTVFDILGIAVEPTIDDYAVALERLSAGEIAAMIYVSGKPTDIFRRIPEDSGLHFLPVPLMATLMETYFPSSLSHMDYPNLVAEGENVETIAIGAVMAVYNWEPNQDRYAKVASFVDAFFNSFEEFLKPPRHKKWQEVNLAAVVPGWTRFSAAQNWLDARPREAAAVHDPELRAAFQTFVQFIKESQPQASGRMGQVDEAALFEQFMEWREQQNNR
ncbi:MAG: TAXI family TRAP transporter solute-binding subunit [Hyphomicrobium sp.]